jgi:hypothetical protein
MFLLENQFCNACQVLKYKYPEILLLGIYSKEKSMKKRDIRAPCSTAVGLR